MRFFGRDEELRELKRIRDLSVSNSRFTVITGRRRVGKTELIERAFGGGTTPYLYFLVTNRAERELCGILQEEAEQVLEEPILGRAERFSQLLEIVMKASLKSPLTLVIDEFQEFDKINPAIFGEIQGVWDRLHKKSKINLVVCGSVNRMMHKIFFDDSQPLYGRNTGSLRLDPFSIGLLKEIHAALYAKIASFANDVDVLVGRIANDRVFQAVQFFFKRIITIETLSEVLKALNLGRQYCAISQKACRNIKILSERDVGPTERDNLRLKSDMQRKRADELTEKIIDSRRRTDGLFFDEICEKYASGEGLPI